MATLNKVFFIGNLTRDPELRYTPGGAAVCEFGIAVNRRFTSNNEERRETCFIDIVVWGRQAESCNRYLQKGSQVFIEGRLQMDQWQDRETGRNRTRLRVVGERVQFLSTPHRSDDYHADADENDAAATEKTDPSPAETPASAGDAAAAEKTDPFPAETPAPAGDAAAAEKTDPFPAEAPAPAGDAAGESDDIPF